MKRIYKIIFASLIFGAGTFYISEYLCNLEVKCKNCPKISESIKNSKENDFFVAYYKPNIDTVNLKNYKHKIIIKNVWVEKSWIRNTNNCLCPKVESTKGYNIVIEFDKTSEDFIFTLKPLTKDKLGKTSFGISQNKKEMRFENLPNKLEIIVEERNPDENVGWTNSIISDTIILSLN